MSAITGAGNYYRPNPYSSRDSRAAAEAAAEEEEDKTADEAEDADETGGTDETDGTNDTDKTPEPEPTEEEKRTLTDYKKEFLAKVKQLMQQPHLAGVGLELGITDAGFKKMMQDSKYEQSVLDKLKSATAHSYNRLSGTLTLSANGNAPRAEIEAEQTFSEKLFSKSSRALLRTLDIDAMSALADDTLAALEESDGRFKLAAQYSTARMRTTASYIDSYLNQLGSVDTTG